MEIRLEGVELRLIRMPLAEAFRAAHGSRTHRDVVLVQVVVRDGPAGWAECVAENEPTYWPEYTAGAWHVLEHHLVPRLLAPQRSLREVRGHQMAKAALETAALDAGLRAEGRSLADFLGAERREVSTGIALGLASTVDDLVAAAASWCAKGHRALKLKIAPGWDLEPVQAVRAAVGDEVTLVVDANGSYRSDDPDHLAVLDRLAKGTGGLAAIEQPFAPADLTGHARLAGSSDVPICLDESIGSLADVDTALALGACGAITLKAGRVGGVVEAHRIHDRCRDEGVALRGGGMLETGLGRAVNLAIAALPGCTLPPDLGPSARYFPRDITPPHLDRGGTMTVPDGPGLGTEPLQEVLDEVTTDTLFLRAPT
jgi:o-succinylbenzoate synthase